MAAPNMKLIRYSVNNEYQEVYSNRTGIDKWSDINYRKITFLEPPTGALLTWLQANGVKQDSTIAAQDTKSVTITKNGTTTITPDAPYDVIKKVNVTTNVGGSSSSGETTNVSFEAGSTNIEMPIAILYQTTNGEYKFNIDHASTENFTLQNVLIGGIIYMYIDPLNESSIDGYFTGQNIDEMSVSWDGHGDSSNQHFTIWKIRDNPAEIKYYVKS